MKFLRIISIFLIILICSTTFTLAKSKIKDYDYGVGIGIPYGGLGVNAEIGKGYVFTIGLGLVPFTDASVKNTQIGWSTGLRFYFKNEIAESLKLRASLLFGTVTYTEKNSTNLTTGGTIKEYELRTGFAPMIGLRGQNWDFDLAFPIGYDVPAGTVERGGSIKISFGFRF